jgi:hypothetical protein
LTRKNKVSGAWIKGLKTKTGERQCSYPEGPFQSHAKEFGLEDGIGELWVRE